MNWYDATEEAYKKGYAKGQEDAAPKWIPVTERLPETFGEYIVTVKALDGTFYFDYADYDPFQQRWTTGLYRCPKEEVTHWMPLPEPPHNN